jgi:hypothetical protein
LWSDGWEIDERDQPNSYKYEKAFRGNPSANDIADSVRRQIEAPEYIE